LWLVLRSHELNEIPIRRRIRARFDCALQAVQAALIPQVSVACVYAYEILGIWEQVAQCVLEIVAD
jgi:hypothetical protein